MRARAILLLCLAILFALTPLMLPSFDGYDPEDFPVRVLGSTTPGALPRMVRLTVLANFASAIGDDNLTYTLIPGRTAADFHWEARSSYAGVPDPF